MLTLDRAVSLQDYEDFARAFAGIAKAPRAWMPVGPGRGVFVTVAGVDGAAIAASSATMTNLLRRAAAFGDPLRAAACSPATAGAVPARAAVKCAIRPRGRPAVVGRRGAAAALLVDALRFGRAVFGQQVTVDEVAGSCTAAAASRARASIALTGPTRARTPRLDAAARSRAAGARRSTALSEPAELLTLDPALARDLEVMA